jgi:phosphomethylpyrimidine synthase
VRDYAKQLGMGAEDALQKGMEEKSVEFSRSGGEIYRD